MADLPEDKSIPRSAANEPQEWKKAEEGWDALKRRAGAIPGLPKANSTHEPPSPTDPKTGGLWVAGNSPMPDNPEKPTGVRLDHGSVTDPIDPNAPLVSMSYFVQAPSSQAAEEQPTPVSGHDPLPKNWIEAVPIVLFGFYGLAFAFGAVEAMNRTEAGLVIADTVGCIICAAIALAWWKRRDWLPQKMVATTVSVITDARWLLVGLSTLLIASMLAPFVEQKRWPLSAWFPIIIHDHAAPAEIAKATSEIQAKLDQAIKERDAAKQGATKETRPAAGAATISSSSKSGDEIGYITLDYSNGDATITGTSYSIKEAIVRAARLTGSLVTGSIGNSYSLPIDIVFNEEIGSVDVFVAHTEYFTVTSQLPNVAVTKNDGSQLEVLLTPSNNFLATMGFNRLLLSFRKR